MDNSTRDQFSDSIDSLITRMPRLGLHTLTKSPYTSGLSCPTIEDNSNAFFKAAPKSSSVACE